MSRLIRVCAWLTLVVLPALLGVCNYFIQLHIIDPVLFVLLPMLVVADGTKAKHDAHPVYFRFNHLVCRHTPFALPQSQRDALQIILDTQHLIIPDFLFRHLPPFLYCGSRFAYHCHMAIVPDFLLGHVRPLNS